MQDSGQKEPLSADLDRGDRILTRIPLHEMESKWGEILSFWNLLLTMLFAYPQTLKCFNEVSKQLSIQVKG